MGAPPAPVKVARASRPRRDPRRTALVVGGGPAGLAAAEVLARAGLAVTVRERMPSVGRKLLIAGRGGLNLTHSEPLARFLDRYGAADPRLLAAVEAFPPERLVAWCEGLGQPTFVGSSGRVFPRAFKASPLLRAWLARLEGLGVRIETRARWLGWAPDGALRFETLAGPDAVLPDATLLALGGASWPRLGSDGAWAPVLAGEGAPVTAFAPANVGFAVAWSEPMRRHAGEPLKRIALAHEDPHGTTHGTTTVRGEAVVTEWGIEGGAVYALGRRLREAVARDGEAVLRVDLRPDLSTDALAQRLAGARRGASLGTVLRGAAGLTPAAAALAQETRPVPREPAALAARIKAAPVRLLAPGSIERAISSAGGLDLAALDARWMVRARPGTFAAGEMLDWEAPTGGYLLQAAFATGIAAARGLLDWLGEPAPMLDAELGDTSAGDKRGNIHECGLADHFVRSET